MALAGLVSRASWGSLRWLGAALGWLVGRVLRVRRRDVLAALARAEVTHPEAVCDAVYRSLATNVFELLWMGGRPSADPRSFVRIPPDVSERIEETLALRRGLVVATAHTGNWDLLACAVASWVPLTVVTKHLSWRSLDRYWQEMRAQRRVHLVDPAGAVASAAGALRSGGAVAFLIDQAPERSSGVLDAPFLGATARHDLSFALVAARYRAPIALALSRRLSDGTHELFVPLLVTPPERASHAWVRATAWNAVQCLDRFVREDPAQWLWLHRRWKA